MLKVLIIDDQKLLRMSLAESLIGEGYEVSSTDTGEKGLVLLEEFSPDIIMLDLKLPGINGIETLKRIKKKRSKTIVLLMTAYGEVETAVEAMRLGAYDYISKPFSLDRIKVTLKNAAESVSLKKEIEIFHEEKLELYGLQRIIGVSSGMKKIFDMIKRISESKATTVLIQGESGTGKELIAKAIHFNSVTGKKPFLEINCASIPENLLESELFGHVKGAFTDAKVNKRGLFELSEGGTLFLDEIGEMGLSMQVKLLRVLEDKCFRPLGGLTNCRINNRVIAATNQKLDQLVEAGRFRRDLFYRLKVVPIQLPPMRDRIEDIPLLVEHFIGSFNQEMARQVKGVSDDTMEILTRYQWPGNVRELRNIIERAFLFADGNIIHKKALPPELLESDRSHTRAILSTSTAPEIEDVDMLTSLKEYESTYIHRVLTVLGGNKSRAAALLGISRPTLRKKLQDSEIVK
jgi:DNA-binding NtrC family response regulator